MLITKHLVRKWRSSQLVLSLLLGIFLMKAQDTAEIDPSSFKEDITKSKSNKSYDFSGLIEAPRVDAKITVDGIVNEAAWEFIKPLEVSQKVPNAFDQPTQKTEIRITYDEKYIYLSGRLYDNEPKKINKNSKMRDDLTDNTDWCGLLIDTYDDRENALAFFVTPNGSRLDMALSNDMVGANAFNVDWNTFWDAKSTITEEGWFTEIRIPFSSLPFEVKEGKTVMGITAWRYLSRNDETDIFPPRDLSTGSSFRASLTQRFVFKNIEEKKPFRLTPYILTGGEQLKALTKSESGEAYTADEAFKREAGLDARMAIGSNVIADITLNTDFAQVEVDDQQINLTRFNLFFPEKRLFFQERASLFDFNFGSYDKIFYSRRIGIVNGNQTRIYGGIRTVAKFGKWEAGFLNVQTASEGDKNSENFGVIRARRRIINENSNIGLISTNRTDLNGNNNTVYGMDTNIKVVAQNYVSARWAQSFDTQIENAESDNSKYFIQLAKRSQNGVVYDINFARTGKNYLPKIGFERRTDYKQLSANISFSFFPEAKSKFVQYGPYVNTTSIWGNMSKELETRNTQIGFQLLTKLGWNCNVSLTHNRELLLRDLSLTDNINIDVGEYNFYNLRASIVSPVFQALSYSVSAEYGDFYDGNKLTLTGSPFMNITPDFIVEGNVSYNKLTLDGKNLTEDILLGNLKLLYTFSTKLTVSSQIQYNSLAKTYAGNLRIRYNPKEGNDFYLVYNGDFNQDRTRAFPVLPINNFQSLQLKYSYTFNL